jgi:hypothetical protein
MGDIEIEILKLRYSNIKLLILESASGLIGLLSANNTSLRDNTAYIVTLSHFDTTENDLSIAESSLQLGVSFLLSPTSMPARLARSPYAGWSERTSG